jgi:hypothetical protein
MTVLAHLAPAQPELPRSGWECPRCLTVYSPDIEACHCATRKPLSERMNRHDQPVQLGGALITFPPGLTR